MIKILAKILDILKSYPERSSECQFYLASAYLKVGEYRIALKHINELLRIQPSNSQALNLKAKIEEKLKNGKMF